jgi:hypothetical protein
MLMLMRTDAMFLLHVHDKKLEVRLRGRDKRYSRLSIIRAWFNRFAAQPRQCIFKENILFSVSITFV